MRSKRSFIGLLVGAVALAGSGVAVVAAPAAAASIVQPTFSGATGTTGCTVNQADNASNSWFPYNLESPASAGVTWTTTYIESATKIDEVKQSSSDSNTDMIYNDGDYAHLSGPPCVSNSQWYGSPNGTVIGYTACWSTTSWGGCQQHRIYLDTAWMNDNSTAYQRTLVLHESGHGLGLIHPRNCTNLPCSDTNISGEVMSASLAQANTAFTTIDKNLIDNNY